MQEQRKSPRAVHSPAAVEEWFRLSTRQVQFRTLMQSQSATSRGNSPAVKVADWAPGPASGSAPTTPYADDPDETRSIREELKSLIKSYRKTDPNGAVSEPRHNQARTAAAANDEDNLLHTRRELQSLITSLRKTGDRSKNLSREHDQHGDLSEDAVARGLNFDDVQDNLHPSANPTERTVLDKASQKTVLVGTVHKSAVQIPDALADMFADVSFVAEQRMLRDSPLRPRASLQLSRPGGTLQLKRGLLSVVGAEYPAGEELSANIEVAGILFQELDELKQQLQYAREEIEGDHSQSESLVSVVERESEVFPLRAKTGQGIAHSVADSLLLGRPKQDTDHNVAATSLENVTDRLEVVMCVVHNLIAFPLASPNSQAAALLNCGLDHQGEASEEEPESELSEVKKIKLSQQQEMALYVRSLVQSVNTSRIPETARTHHSSPSGENPDGSDVSPILRPSQSQNQGDAHFLYRPVRVSKTCPPDPINDCSQQDCQIWAHGKCALVRFF